MRKNLLFLSLWLGLASTVWGQTGTLVKDIYPLSGSSGVSFRPDVIGNTASLGNTLIFGANNSTHGFELWKTDGTPDGTNMLKDMTPGGSSSNSNIFQFFSHNNLALFWNYSSANSAYSLWRTDGTDQGTFNIDDAPSRAPKTVYTFSGDSALYMSTGDVVYSKSLDNTSRKVAFSITLTPKIPKGDYIYSFIKFGNKWLFNTTSSTGLFITDGTQNGTIELASTLRVDPVLSGIKPEPIAFFAYSDGTNGNELWKTDGTPNGTKMVKNIAPGGVSSSPTEIRAVPNGVVFLANDGVNGQELWFSDGTEAGTKLIKEFTTGNNAFFDLQYYFFQSIYDTSVYFRRGISEYWKTDGTPEGTIQVFNSPNLVVFSNASYIQSNNYVVQSGGYLYFLMLNLSKNWVEAWRSNGKPDGNVMVGVLSNCNSYPYFRVAGNNLYYSGDDSKTGVELWKLPLCAHTAKINTPTGTSFCTGSSIAISAEGSGGTGGYTYKWKSGSSDVGTNATLSVTKAGTYTVEVINQGCTVSSSVEVKETASLPVSITGANSVCAGTTSPLSATVSGGVAPYIYQWKQSGVTINGATTTALSVTGTGVYSVSVVDSKGCTGSSTGFLVTVKPSPTPTITTATTSLTSGASAVLVTAAASGQTYQWYRDKQLIAGATNNTYSTTATGDYTVMVTRDGCSATSPPLTLQMVLANEPTPSLLGLAILPNPVQQNAEVRLSLYKAAPATFILVDAGGKLIGEWQSPQLQTNHTLNVSMKTQPSGVYFLKVEANGLQAVRRVLKQ